MGNRCPKCNADNLDDSRFCHKCATPLPSQEEISVSHTKTLETPVEELTRGTTFASRYEIIEELGKGGMGEVYRVEDKKIKEEVALKLIKPEIALDKKTIERFSNELKMARKIAHRNVCKMYDLGEEKGTPYITMEYVPGEDLKSFIRRSEQLTAGKSISIAKQVCDGLEEAHKLGVIHRDLKPSNIMIDKEGNAHIMDFGIARSVTGKGITGAGVMIGTPEYMSPEQVDGKETDQRSDIYSLGVMLYEMVTGRVPFEGETPLGIAMKHKSEMPKDPREINAQIPEDLSHSILKCLQKDKESRYQSADHLFNDLNNIEKGIPVADRVAPKKKPIATREITVSFKLRRLLIPAFILLVIIVTALIILNPWSQDRIVAIPPDRPSVAVMYFKNNTGEKSLDHWRAMLSNLIIADLTQSSQIRILSEEKLFKILSQLNQLDATTYSSEALEQVAAQGGVNHILQGAFAKAGDEFRINVLLHGAKTGELLGSESVAGVGEESIFSMVDELTKRIKLHFKLSKEVIANDIDMDVGKITTGYPEAYKYYTEARKYHREADYQKSIEIMKRAVEIDSGFAMAYRSIAASYNNLGEISEARKYIKRALNLTGRLSERARYIIQGDFYDESEKTYDKAMEAYNNLLELYPDDLSGNNNLAGIYMDLEELDRAIELFNKAIRSQEAYIATYYNLALAYMFNGMYNRAKEVLESYVNNISDNALLHDLLTRIYLIQGKYDLALVEIGKAFSIGPVIYRYHRMKGDIYYFKGNLIKAEEIYIKLQDFERTTAKYSGRLRLGSLYLFQGRFDKAKNQLKQGIEMARKLGLKVRECQLHLFLGYMHIRSGNPEEAFEEFNKAWIIAIEEDSISEQRWALYWKGIACLEMSSWDKVQGLADELKEFIEMGMNKKIIRLYYHLIGMIELGRENFSKAIENFKKAMPLLNFQASTGDDHALFFDSLALAYYKIGDLEKAQDEYERIISLTTGRFEYGDIYAKSFYMLGKIYEQKAWKGKAIEHYEKFLSLWKDADPGIAEVEDAKKRLGDGGMGRQGDNKK